MITSPETQSLANPGSMLPLGSSFRAVTEKQIKALGKDNAANIQWAVTESSGVVGRADFESRMKHKI